MAASLGYAPALYEIFKYYIHEKKDPLLGLVYLNLTIGYGHREYRERYYKQTELLDKLAGPAVIHEIERIALSKTIKISKCITEIEKTKNVIEPGLSFIDNRLTISDSVYTEVYWKPFFNTEELWRIFFRF